MEARVNEERRGEEGERKAGRGEEGRRGEGRGGEGNNLPPVLVASESAIAPVLPEDRALANEPASAGGAPPMRGVGGG